MPKDIRIDIVLKGVWVRYPKADEFIRFLEKLSRQPKRPRMEGRLIVGPTNNGKTSIIQEFIHLQKDRNGYDDASFYEYLYVETPEIPSVKALYTEIGTKCNHPNLSGTAEQLKLRVLRTLKDLKVKMLFIDEIHNLLTAQNERILNQCRNALKGLSNRLQIPIILIGTEEAEDVLQGDPQVLNRYPIIRLHPWKNDNDFRLLLHAFETQLPLQKASNLHNITLAKKIYDLSDGILGNVSTIVRESAIEALERGTERITLKIINELQEGNFAPF